MARIGGVSFRRIGVKVSQNDDLGRQGRLGGGGLFHRVVKGMEFCFNRHSRGLQLELWFRHFLALETESYRLDEKSSDDAPKKPGHLGRLGFSIVAIPVTHIGMGFKLGRLNLRKFTI